ncbi:LOW QUALITY PROTEIN: uncharacterized protein WM294_015470 [Sarcoramphus papa]
MPFPGARRRRKQVSHKARGCPRTASLLGRSQPSEPVMAGEIVYADLRHPGDGFSPAEKRHAPALCPQWHGVLLKVSALGHVILLVLVAVLSVQAFQPLEGTRLPHGDATRCITHQDAAAEGKKEGCTTSNPALPGFCGFYPQTAAVSHPRSFLQVFQGSLQPTATSVPWQGSETRGRNHTERCVISSLMRYFCRPRRESPAACAGCKLCPQDWQLHGDSCYRLSKEKGNWYQGKKGCESQESQLVVLRDRKEKEYIKNITGGGTQPVWIGLVSSHNKWRWVDNTSLNTKMFGALQEMDEGCGTLKDEALEDDICDGEHEWVCQKDPFQLSPSMAGDGEKCDASV